MFLSIDINVNGLIQGKCRRKPMGQKTVKVELVSRILENPLETLRILADLAI